MAVTRYRMRVIPEPPEGTNIVDEIKPASRTQNDMEFVCGKCTATLIPLANMEQVMGMILKCKVCGAFNQVGH